MPHEREEKQQAEDRRRQAERVGSTEQDLDRLLEPQVPEPPKPKEKD